ncbi:MAG: putative methyltransferase [Magnetococcales bacterium]|nr:putative methyltransferase [Magnetococcales bacterium]
MKTEWKYTDLAEAYLKRPDYAEGAIDAMLAHAGATAGAPVCDVGAGVGHLTRVLAARKLLITAVEPNDAMRNLGIKATRHFDHVRWFEGTGEITGQPEHTFDLVTFGSSFNVCDRQRALTETARILKSHGFFACMWNHRHLDDPFQTKIEHMIADHIPGYNYGTRREDQTEVIAASGLFEDTRTFEANIIHQQSAEDCLEAWRSHATLHRQAGERFTDIIAQIQRLLNELGQPIINIPYTTRIWVARKKE